MSRIEREIEARIARIRQLLDELTHYSADTREEALAATEQLLHIARQNHEEARHLHYRAAEHFKARKSKTAAKRRRPR